MTEDWFSYVVVVLAAIIGSGPLWSFVTGRFKDKKGHYALLMAMAHSRIVGDAGRYLERGWLTQSEYDNFMYFLYIPYSELGGNSLANKMIKDIKDLPIRSV